MFSRALPGGIFCAWAEGWSFPRGVVFARVSVVLSACDHFYANFRAPWVPDYADSTHLKLTPEEDWPIITSSLGWFCFVIVFCLFF